MKAILKFIGSTMLSLAIISCGSDDGSTVSTQFDGSYHGVVYEVGQIGNYTLTVSNGQVSGVYSDGFESISFSGTVDVASVYLDIDYGDGYIVSATFTFVGTGITGSWEDNEGGNGALTGSIQTSDYDGNYSGSASSQGVEIGTFSASINNGKVTGTYTEDGETTAINGFISTNGTATLNIIYSDGTITSLTGSISGNTISGTFSYSGGGSGTFSGQKS